MKAALRTALAASGLLLALPGAAQRPASWVADGLGHAPGGVVQHLGKILWYVDSGTLHAFSAATRSWSQLAVSATATIRNTNDWLLVVDGTSIAALGAARGRFETISVSPQASVLNKTTGVNDSILLVLDGTTLWSFSGFIGRWAQRAIVPTAGFSLQRNVAMMVDGASMWAMSALFGDWVRLDAGGTVATFGVGDTVGWAADATNAYCFSAIHNRWTSAALPAGGGPLPSTQGDIAVWTTGLELLGYSGVRGVFDRVFTAQQVTVEVADHLAHARTADQRSHWLFSVPHGQWTAFQTAQSALAQVAGATVLLIEPDKVHAYSAPNASVATLAVVATVTATNTAVAGALNVGTGELQMFSALTGAWHPAPTAARRVIPTLTRNGAVLTDGGTTAWAFSARSGQFVRRNTAANPTVHIESNSALQAIEDDASFAVFDPRREIWIETPLSAGVRPLNVRIWRTTLVALAANEAIGYGVLHGAIERAPISGAVVDLRASSEVGAVITTGGVVAYSPVSDLRTEAQFPEFRRMVGRGAAVDLKCVGRPVAAVAMLVGLPSATAFNFPAWGDFTLDPAILIPIGFPVLGTEGTAQVRLALPDLPQFAGLEVAFQALVVPAVGQAYFTRMPTFRIH
jgi:hypothetical protein